MTAVSFSNPGASTTAVSPMWLLLADKPGDNEQVLALAEMLALPRLIKRVRPKARYVLGKPWFRATLDHLDLSRSDPLVPPWPKLVITIGRRPTMAALWVRRQSARHTRIILLGRQPRFLHEFALVISSSQYITASDPRILRIALPLNRNRRDPPMSSAPTIDVTALLVGGPTRTFRLTVADAERLLHSARLHSKDLPLLILSSRRTPKEVAEYLASNLPAGSRFVPWTTGDTATPSYQQVLSGCRRFIVTGDSISMICEVVRMAKPLAIFRLEPRNWIIRLWHCGVLAVAPLEDGKTRNGLIARIVRWLVDARWIRLPRSFDAFYAFLFQQYAASDLTHGFLEHYAAMPDMDRDRVAGRVAELLDKWQVRSDVSTQRPRSHDDDSNS